MSKIDTGASGGGGGTGTVTSVLGTANQITSDGSTTTPTLSLSATLVAPGTVTATTSVASPFFASTNADVADAGAIRLGNAETIAWEASPASTDVTMTVNSAEQFVFSNAILSPTLVTPALGTPASGVMTNVTGLTEAGQTLADNTTNNASTSAHGYLLKLNNSATQFMNGQGAWATPAASVTWDTIGNAAGSLTLANGTNATTFNQTSAAIWTWANTTAATNSTVSNSPVIKIAQKTWTGSSTDETLTMTFATGTGSNAAVNQSWVTAGSTGGTIFNFNDSSASGSTSTTLKLQRASTDVVTLTDDGTNIFIWGRSPGATFFQSGFGSGQTPALGIGIGLTTGSSYTATSGTQIGTGFGGSTNAVLTFAPTSGTAKFVGVNIAPIINQTGGANGDYTALQINATETAAGGTNKLLFDAQLAGTSKASITSGGIYSSAGSAGVSAGSFGAVTAITTVGGIVTQLTGTSDERLKDANPYEDGLETILGINPVTYRWNEAGQKHTGLGGEQEYVGFIAQNVQKSIPQAITTTEGPEKYLAMDDRPIIAALVNTIKELNARLEKLETKRRK